MNYIGLVALILGLVSIFITLKYVDNYDKLSYQLSKVGNNIKFKYPQELLDIQDELDLSDNDFKKIIINKRKEIIEIMKKIDTTNKKETFIDFNIYLSAYQRRIPHNELSDLFKKAKIEMDKTTSFDFKDELDLAKTSINKQDRKNRQNRQDRQYSRYYDYSNLNSKNSKYNNKLVCNN